MSLKGTGRRQTHATRYRVAPRSLRQILLTQRQHQAAGGCQHYEHCGAKNLHRPSQSPQISHRPQSAMRKSASPFCIGEIHSSFRSPHWVMHVRLAEETWQVRTVGFGLRLQRAATANIAPWKNRGRVTSLTRTFRYSGKLCPCIWVKTQQRPCETQTG